MDSKKELDLILEPNITLKDIKGLLEEISGKLFYLTPEEARIIKHLRENKQDIDF